MKYFILNWNDNNNNLCICLSYLIDKQNVMYFLVIYMINYCNKINFLNNAVVISLFLISIINANVTKLLGTFYYFLLLLVIFPEVTSNVWWYEL